MRGPSTSAQQPKHVLRTRRRRAAVFSTTGVPLPAPAAAAAGVVTVQAAIVVAGRVPRRGMAPPQGELEEPPQQERDGRGRRRAQGMHRIGLRIRVVAGGGARSAPLRYVTGAGALLRRQQELQQLPPFQAPSRRHAAVFLRRLRRLRQHRFFPRQSPHRYTRQW